MSRPPGLPPVYGHEELRERIRRAAGSGRLPQSLLLHGPEGVGKQRLGLWIASLLLCAEGAPCGECRSCRLAATLQHPDIHWYFPLARPGGGSRRALREKLEEARLEELDRRRNEPLEPRTGEGPTGIYLAAVEEIRAQAARRPAMGSRCAFIIGEAEQMVPQAASPEAANAFLKLLEEPPPHASLILTTSRPRSLLPTIRSRTLAVRIPPLERKVVEEFLVAEAGMAAEAAAGAASLAQGSIGRALRIARGQGAEERGTAARMLRAALSPRDSDRLRLAAEFGARRARGEFEEILGALDELLRDLLIRAAGRPEAAFDPELALRIAGDATPEPSRVARATDHLEAARAAARGNANPQATAAVLLFDLHRALGAGS